MASTAVSTPTQRDSAADRTVAPSVILFLFTVSGASGLMLEVIWSRMLVPLLGATTWSVLTVLVAFMGGLGLGSIVWGRWAGRSPRPLRLYGWLEVAIGLYALSVPLLFAGIGEMVVATYRIVGESAGAEQAVRVVAAVLALAPPTLLMGGTLPILTRFATMGRAESKSSSGPGKTAGGLYAANTAGAVAGCFLTGCVLILWLGVVETNWLAAFLDISVGIAALGLSARGASAPFWVPSVDEPVSRLAARAARAGGQAVLIATASGFCGLAYEVLWTRGLMATVTDDTTYAFSMMLTAFLAGHAAGAALAGRVREPRPGDDWRRLGVAQMLAALTALLSLPLLVAVRGSISGVAFTERMTFWGARVPFHLAISLAVFAPSAAFLGASFALSARLYIGRGRPVAASTGRLYGLNTLGAIAGAVAATAWLIPALGTQHTIVVLAALQAAGGGMAIVFGGRPAGARAAAGWATAVAAACGLNWLLPLTNVYARQEPGRLLALVEGSGAAVTVHERTVGDRVISINGVNVAGTNPVLRATQKLQAHLPVCLHPAPRSVLQIGFGSGGTCFSVSLHREVESIDVAEINPDVLNVAAEWFADINHGVLGDPRVHVRIVDARSYLAVTERSYDLILSDSTHPRFRGNAALYARDYFLRCARHLRPGGICSTWLPLYGMSVDDVRGILKSIHSVFPHVQVWYANAEPHENTILIASLSPLAIDPERLSRRISEPEVAADLAGMGVISTPQLLDFFMLGDRAVEAFSSPGRLNTDDHPRLEFLAPRSLRRKRSWEENFAALRQAREPLDPYLVNVDDSERARYARWYAGTTCKLAGQSHELAGQLQEALNAYTEGTRLNPDDLLARVRLERFRQSYEALRGTGGRTQGVGSGL
jgi:spermidine synthase